MARYRLLQGTHVDKDGKTVHVGGIVTTDTDLETQFNTNPLQPRFARLPDAAPAGPALRTPEELHAQQTQQPVGSRDEEAAKNWTLPVPPTSQTPAAPFNQPPEDRLAWQEYHEGRQDRGPEAKPFTSPTGSPTPATASLPNQPNPSDPSGTSTQPVTAQGQTPGQTTTIDQPGNYPSEQEIRESVEAQDVQEKERAESRKSGKSKGEKAEKNKS